MEIQDNSYHLSEKVIKKSSKKRKLKVNIEPVESSSKEDDLSQTSNTEVSSSIDAKYKNKNKISKKSVDSNASKSDPEPKELVEVSIENNEVENDGKTKRKNKEGRHLTCILCRQDGHIAKNCRLNKGKKIDLTICFNCGSREHILKECNQPKSSNLSFATCFICTKVGHISKDCPDNPNGLYPNGGCCHICQLKTHFSRDCPKRREQNKNRIGFSPGQAKPQLTASNIQSLSQGDDEEFEEPFYQVEEIKDELKPKKKKFNINRDKYYAKPKPRPS